MQVRYLNVTMGWKYTTKTDKASYRCGWEL